MFVYKVSDILKFDVDNVDVCVDIYMSHNSSDFASGTNETEPVTLSTQDMEVLQISWELEFLQFMKISVIQMTQEWKNTSVQTLSLT